MANLPIEEIEKMVGSRYALTVLAGKRARDLRDGAPQLVNSDSSNPILVALQEIYEGKIVADNLDLSAGIEEREAQMMAEAALAARAQAPSTEAATARAILLGTAPDIAAPAPEAPADEVEEALSLDAILPLPGAEAAAEETGTDTEEIEEPLLPGSVAISEAEPTVPESITALPLDEDEEDDDLVDPDEFEELDGNIIPSADVSEE